VLSIKFDSHQITNAKAERLQKILVESDSAQFLNLRRSK